MFVASPADVELRRAEKLVRKDHRQRWVFYGPNGWYVSDVPRPFRDGYSIYWMPIQQCVACNYRPRVLAHNAIGAL